MAIPAGAAMTWEPDYITRSQLKDYLHIGDTGDDTLLDDVITTASRAVDEWCHRQFGQSEAIEVREFDGYYDPGSGSWLVETHDISSTASLIVADATGAVIDAADCAYFPRNAVVTGKPVERIVISGAYCSAGSSTRQVFTLTTDAWGWAAVPAAVPYATRLQAARLMVRRDSPYGIAGSPAQGSEMRLLAQLDPDLQTSLKRYRRDTWVS